MEKGIIRALALSGGGSRGSYVGGMLEYMIRINGNKYNNYYGTSTGTLLQMFASINEFDSLKEAYTSMDIEKMYDIYPFKKSNKIVGNSEINIWSVIRMIFFRKQPTFGDSSKFKVYIKEIFTYKHYLKAYDSGVNLNVTVTNLSKVKTEYFSMRKLGRTYKGYLDFIEWTWTSTCATPFSSLPRMKANENGNILLDINSCNGEYLDYYADGGFMESLPICKAIEDGATVIDAISTHTNDYKGDLEPEFGSNPLKLLSRMFEVTLREGRERDIDKAKKLAIDRDVELNIYRIPEVLTKNSMQFNKKQMSDWWEDGFNYISDMKSRGEEFCDKIILKANI